MADRYADPARAKVDCAAACPPLGAGKFGWGEKNRAFRAPESAGKGEILYWNGARGRSRNRKKRGTKVDKRTVRYNDS